MFPGGSSPYFASVNYAFRFQESATSLITPPGQCQAYLPYGQEGVLVQAIKVEEATGVLATRYAPERYEDFRSEEPPRIMFGTGSLLDLGGQGRPQNQRLPVGVRSRIRATALSQPHGRHHVDGILEMRA